MFSVFSSVSLFPVIETVTVGLMLLGMAIVGSRQLGKDAASER